MVGKGRWKGGRRNVGGGSQRVLVRGGNRGVGGAGAEGVGDWSAQVGEGDGLRQGVPARGG